MQTCPSTLPELYWALWEVDKPQAGTAHRPDVVLQLEVEGSRLSTHLMRAVGKSLPRPHPHPENIMLLPKL